MLRRVSSRRIVVESDAEEVEEMPKVPSKPSKRKLAETSLRSQGMQSTNAEDIFMGSSRPTSRSASSGHPHSLHSVKRIAACCGDLLLWYAGVKTVRGMPWRKDYDPSLSAYARAQRAYEVLVSEIMLQQTQIVTVIPYYNNWMKAFPTITALALADVDQVNQRWKGLGYYSRGSRLLDAARVVVRDMNGHFPEDAASMEVNLPGVGRYTAGAVCSIVFDEHTPAVDGNVQRLLSRLLALHAPLKGSNAKAPLKLVWDAATELVKGTGKGEAGAFNQALIELGSTVCKPTNPNCGECPIKQGCGAYLLSEGKTLVSSEVIEVEDLCELCEPFTDTSTAVIRYPMKVQKKKPREEHSAVRIIEYCGKSDRWVLLVRRPEKGLLAGLLEFPTLLLDDSSEQCEDLASDVLLSRFLASPPPLSEERDGSTHNLKLRKSNAGTLLHIFSHIRMTYYISHIQITRINDTEEGDNLPELLEPIDSCPPNLADSDNLSDNVGAQESTPKKKKRKIANTKAKVKVANAKGNNQEVQRRVKWVKIASVEGENISTGALKIWKQVMKRSENHR